MTTELLGAPGADPFAVPSHEQLPILVVDDDEPTLLLLRHTLELAGYANVRTTADPGEAAGIFETVRPRLVLLDVHMPGIDGLELMTRLRSAAQRQGNVPFLVMTADATYEAKLRALSLGAGDFLPKPLDPAELLLRVGNLLEGQQLHEQLAEENADLVRQQLGLLWDLEAMQAALVPDVSPNLGGLGISVAYQPAEGPAAGGDFYDLFMPQPGRVAIIVGDVMGHGREALAHAALTRFTLRAYLQAGLEPRAALAMAGHVLADPNYERYATAAVGIYEAGSRRLTYALAGHPPPILMEFGCLVHEPLVVCSSPPIGWTIPTGRRQTTVSLGAGTEACFFTDGLVEARRGGELVGRERLHELLALLGPQAGARELIEGVRASAERVADDMVACILSPQLTAAGEHVHIEELEVDAAGLERGSVRRFLRMCAIGPPQIERALKRAGHIVATSGTALLRVRLAPGHEVVVAPPGSRAARV